MSFQISLTRSCASSEIQTTAITSFHTHISLTQLKSKELKVIINVTQLLQQCYWCEYALLYLVNLAIIINGHNIGIYIFSIIVFIECPDPAVLYYKIGGIVGGTFLIGLVILILWKVMVTIHDKREFSRFEREEQLRQWSPVIYIYLIVKYTFKIQNNK